MPLGGEALLIISSPLEKKERLICLLSVSLFSPLGLGKLLKKLRFFFGFLFPWGSHKLPGWCPHPSLFFLRCSRSLWPLALLFHTAVYYLISPPLSTSTSLTLSLFLSPPKLT